MKTITIRRMRGLQQYARPRSSDSALSGFKLEVASTLAGEATAVLLDPEYFAAQVVAVDFKTYLQQVTTTCKPGASGIAVGRGVWKEAVPITPAKCAYFLRGISRKRLARLASFCTAPAKQ